MASLNRARRTTQGSVLRPFALLVVVSLLLLGLRNTDAVRGSSTFLTQLLVPVQRVLATSAPRVTGLRPRSRRSIASARTTRAYRRTTTG